MVEAPDLPLFGWAGKFRLVSLAGFREYPGGGATGTRATTPDTYRARPVADSAVSLAMFFCTGGDAPVITGDALRPPRQPPGA